MIDPMIGAAISQSFVGARAGALDLLPSVIVIGAVGLVLVSMYHITRR